MARIKVTLPDKYAFSVDIPIRIGDINPGGHLSWDAMFNILDEAHVRFWNSLNLTEIEGRGISRIMADAGINYKRQAYHGQTLRVEIGIAELTARSFDLVYRVTDADNGDEIARAKTGFLCYDYRKQKVVPVPEELKSKLVK